MQVSREQVLAAIRKVNSEWMGGEFTRGRRPETIPPEIVVKGRTWRFVGVEPYTRKSDGRETTLLRWRSACSTCGAPFDVLTPNTERAVSGADHNLQQARCGQHRRPSNLSQAQRARYLAAIERRAEIWRMARDQVETDEEAHAILELIL